MSNWNFGTDSNESNLYMDSFGFNIDEEVGDDFGFSMEEEPSDDFGFNIDDLTETTETTEKKIEIKTVVEKENKPKYDNFGNVINMNEENAFENDFDSDEQFIEFGVMDLNKSQISTKKQWNVEDDKPGAFFIYNPSRDLSYSRMCLRNKENQEIVWQSPIRLLDNQIKLEEKKSPIVYMSVRALRTEDIDTKNGKYEIFMEDDELEIADFIVVDDREKFKDIVIKRDENLSKYIINCMLNYFPINIDMAPKSEEYNEFTQSIIIEKIGNKYTVLINKLEGILNRTLFFRNEDSIYHSEKQGISVFLNKIQTKICNTYGLSPEEYNAFAKLIIVDDEKSKNELAQSNLEVNGTRCIDRKDICKDLVNENMVLIDVDESSLGVLFTDENNNLINIRTKALGTDKTENIVEEIKAIRELFDSNIILTGKEINFNEKDGIEFKSLSKLISQ